MVVGEDYNLYLKFKKCVYRRFVGNTAIRCKSCNNLFINEFTFFVNHSYCLCKRCASNKAQAIEFAINEHKKGKRLRDVFENVEKVQINRQWRGNIIEIMIYKKDGSRACFSPKDDDDTNFPYEFYEEKVCHRCTGPSE